MSHVLAAVAALAVAFAASPSPAPTPFAIGTFQPFGTGPAPAPAANLPEIGRVRAATPACAAMRDLVIPSFAAARRADARFAQTQARLPQYVEYADDALHQADIYRESALAKLSDDATTILNETLVLNRALGDARFKNPSDPQIRAQRDQLQQLYNTQQQRANQLQEFVMREQVAIAKNGGIGDSHALDGRTGPVTPQTAAPMPRLTAPPGMPVLNGKIAIGDKNAINDWSGSMAKAVRASENQAAQTFLPIAHSCR